MVGRIRLVNSSNLINLQKMKNKFMQIQEQLGNVDKLSDYQIMQELLIN